MSVWALCAALLLAPLAAEEPPSKYQSEAGWGMHLGYVPGAGMAFGMAAKFGQLPCLLSAEMVWGVRSAGMDVAADWRLTHPSIRWNIKAYYGPGVGAGYLVTGHAFAHLYAAVRFSAGLEWIAVPPLELYAQVSGQMGLAFESRTSVRFPYLSLPFLAGFRYWM